MTQYAKNTPFFVDNEIIRLTKNGIWLSDGVVIAHVQTRRIFAKCLVHDTEGWQIRIGRETKRIEVEDTAYFVTRIEGSATQGFEVYLSDESHEKLDPSTLSYRPGRLVCRIKKGKEEAKFLHAPYFEILKDLEEDDASYWLKLGGQRVQLTLK